MWLRVTTRLIIDTSVDKLLVTGHPPENIAGNSQRKQVGVRHDCV